MIGGIEAAIMRIQLIVPHNHFVSPQVFNRMFTMHGTTMIFFVAMPILFGFGTYLIPLMIGAQGHGVSAPERLEFLDDCFWRAASLLQLHRRQRALRRGERARCWLVGICAADFRAFSAGTAPITGRSRLLVSGYRQHRNGGQFHGHDSLHALPRNDSGENAAAGLAEPGDGRDGDSGRLAAHGGADHAMMDRYLGGHFFDTQAGGSAVLWMHFFWIFGHPEVYVLIIPGVRFHLRNCPGVLAQAIFGYPVMVAATVAIGFVSISVWAHHMFTVGMNSYANSFFAITTMAVGVPTGIKIFNWLGTMWGGKIQFRAPMMFCIGFLFQFLIAGLTGIMLAASPFNWQLSDSYFVVAHFHYVIVGGILFALFGAFYYWFPKMTAGCSTRRLGKWHFWLFVIGFHITFDFMHIPGILGMPRRIYTYEPGRGWETGT